MFSDDDVVMFLGIDGVLNSLGEPEVKVRSKCAKALNAIMDSNPNLYIIFLDNHFPNISHLKFMLKNLGVSHSKRISNLVSDSKRNPSEAISSMIKRYHIRRYIVLSNKSIKNLSESVHCKKLIRVTGDNGLTMAHAKEAIVLLSQKDDSFVSDNLIFEWRKIVQELMKEKDITYASLAKEVDMDPANLRKRIISGNVTLDTLDRIFNGLGMTIKISVEEKES